MQILSPREMVCITIIISWYPSGRLSATSREMFSLAYAVSLISVYFASMNAHLSLFLAEGIYSHLIGADGKAIAYGKAVVIV